MKKITLLIASLLFSFVTLLGQSKIDSLVQIGIKYHDNREYEKAIDAYKEALKIEPKSALINYELALTYMYSGDHEKCIEHSDVVIEQNDKYVLFAYTTKGSALDNLGKTEESINLLEKAIEKLGGNYMLLYNLGVNYVKMNDYEKAEPILIEAIKDNANHASSHRLLAIIKSNQNQRVQSLLGLYYFLFLEPESQRAKTAFELLKKQFKSDIPVEKGDGNNVYVTLDSRHADSEFSPAETMIALLEAMNFTDEKEGKSAEEIFISNTKMIFSILGELKGQDKDGLWWDFYVPFFYELAKSDYLDVFCYYISLSSNENAVEWLESNIEKLEGFKKWLE